MLCIGPAGENLVRYAAVANDRNRVYGRCGPGAVWGSKKLKAVRVRGREKIAIADEGKYRPAYDQAIYLMKQAPVTKRLMRDLGTAGLVELINLISMLPHENFQDCTHRDEDVESISGETLAKTLLEKAGSCYLCPIGCQRHTARRRPRRPGGARRGPGIRDRWSSWDRSAASTTWPPSPGPTTGPTSSGLDTMSYGGTVACAMELAGRGLIRREETGGLDLAFGNAEALEALVDDDGPPRRARRRAGRGRLPPGRRPRPARISP